MNSEKQYIKLKEEVTELKQQLHEAHEIIDAIRKGEVDAFIVKNGEDKHQIYTLKSADLAYRLFIEKMNEGAITFNEEGIIIYSNSSFAKLFNVPLKTVIGNPFINFIPVAYREVVNNLIKKAWLEEENKTEIIVNNNKKIGIPVLLSMNKLEIDGGVALSVIATDLSLQKETQQQKITMEKMDEFISIASHELKTPVTSIKGYVQLLKHNFQKEGHETASGLISRVEGQVNKLATLVAELLDVKKIETGQLQYNEEEFEINELVKEVVHDCEMNLKRHSVTLDFCGPQILKGDRNKIGQVISNFLDNAVKYSPHNSTIYLKTSVEENKVCVHVKDEGIGIPLAKQNKIYERFYRVSGEKENTYSGLGLGLYIAAEIIQRHNGIIGVESKDGKGSTFYFKLPLSN